MPAKAFNVLLFAGEHIDAQCAAVADDGIRRDVLVDEHNQARRIGSDRTYRGGRQAGARLAVRRRDDRHADGYMTHAVTMLQ